MKKVLFLFCFSFFLSTITAQSEAELPETDKIIEAKTVLLKGEEYIQIGKDSLALYGDSDGYVGFEAIISVANLAKAYAGISHANLGNYEKAIAYLEDYDDGDDEIFNNIVKEVLGDCLVNIGRVEESIKYFETAAHEIQNSAFSSMCYKKAALAYRELNNYSKVIDIFTLIKDKYPQSKEAIDADKYIEEATSQLNR